MPSSQNGPESCAWCDGSGQTTAERNFLLVRLHARHDHRWIGRCSDAMVVAVMVGGEPEAKPYDGWDLGRCLITRAVAPGEMHRRMDEIIAAWTAELERVRPAYVEDALAMQETYEGAVRERIEAYLAV